MSTKEPTLSGDSPLAKPKREEFARLAAKDAYTDVAIAERLGITRKTCTRWRQDPLIAARVKFLKKQRAERTASEPLLRNITAVNLTRNDIIEGLLAEANAVKPSHARIAAWNSLAEIYLLKARNIEDLRNGIGWTEDELEYANRTGLVPPRVAALIGATKLQDLAEQDFAREQSRNTKRPRVS